MNELTKVMEDKTVKKGYVYILASRKNGTLYIGVTSNIARRVFQHKKGEADGFTKKYGVTRLVYVETHQDMYSAITREKALKRWNRAWKIRLIMRDNPDWKDISNQIN